MDAPKTMTEYLDKHLKKGFSYNDFYRRYLDGYRELYENSTAPRNELIEMFYDDYINRLSNLKKLP